MNFDFIKSSEPDLQNKIQSELFVLMKNVLYITHECDKILKIVNELKNDKSLQKQVDDYYGDSEPNTHSD